MPVWKSKFYGAFVLNRRVVLHAIDATPARWRGDAGSSPLDRARTAASSPRNDLVKNCRVQPTHWLISTQECDMQVANNRNMKSCKTSVFCAGTGVAAEASGQNARSCCGSSAPGGASMYSTSMQMPTVSKASTWPGRSGAGSSTESSETTG